jgi:amino acid transporter
MRKASGLTRRISSWDALIINLAAIGVLYVFQNAALVPGLYPGAYMPLMPLTTVAVIVPYGAVYVMLATSMPRSGGDYVWVSRSLNPALGFLTNFYLTITAISFVGSALPWSFSFGLSPMFWTLGKVTGNQSYLSLATFFQSTNVGFWGTFLLILAATALLIVSYKWSIRLQWILTGFAVLTGVLFVILALVVGPSGFHANFDATSGVSYDAIISAAKGAGYVVPPNIGATFASSVYALLTLLGFMYSAYIAGEVKGVQKSQIIAQFGSMIFTVVMLTAIYASLIYVFGNDFYNALASLWFHGDSRYPFTNLPLVNLLLVFVTANPLALVLINLGFVVTPIVMTISIMFATIRNVFAWSYDRVLPVRFAAINSRFGTPIWASLLVSAIAVVFDLMYSYTNILTYFASYGIFGWFLAVCFVSVAAIVFPYRRKDIFDASPSIVKRKIFGIPVLSIFGVWLLIGSIVTAYWTILPALSGSIANAFVYGVAVLYVIGVVVYYVSHFYQKRKGVPVEFLQKEIPPE